MSKGLSRNTANKTATYCREHNIEYASYFMMVATNCLIDAVEKVHCAINNFAESFIDFAERNKNLYQKVIGDADVENIHSR